MRFWRPERGAPHLLEWWAPLVKAARRALDRDVHWLIVLDEWHLEGRVQRQGRPDIWVYVNRLSGAPLNVDGDGRTYRFVYNRSGASLGRYKEVDIRAAVHQAGLPEVGRAVWYAHPAPFDEDWEEPLPAEEEPGTPPALRVVR